MANDYKPLNNAATNLEELLMVQNSDGVYASKYNGKEPFEVLAAKTIFNNYADVQAAIAADVEGPAFSTDNALARFDGTTGKLLQNSNAILTDAGALSLASNLTVSGGTITGANTAYIALTNNNTYSAGSAGGGHTFVGTGNSSFGGNLTVSGTTGVTATDVILGSSGPSVKSSLSARAPRQGLVFDGTFNASISTAVPAFGTNDFSVAAIVNTDLSVNLAGIIGSNTTGGFGLFLYNSGVVNVQHIGVATIGSSTGAISANKSTLVVYTRSGTTGTFYINGVAAGTITDGSGGTPTNYSQTTNLLGQVGGLNIIKGTVAPLIYNRALSASEVVSLYEAGAPAGADYNNASSTNIITGDAWYTTVQSGTAISSGVATITTPGNLLGRATAVTVGKRYRVSVNITASTGGAVVRLFEITTGTNRVIGSAAGTNTLEFTATSADQYFNISAGTATFNTISLIPLGLLLAPDAAQAGGGLTWYDTSGNAANISWTSGVSWNVPSSRVLGGNWTTSGTLGVSKVAGGEASVASTLQITSPAVSETGAGGLEWKADVSNNGYGFRTLPVFNGVSSYDLYTQSRSNSASWTTRMSLTNSGNLLIGTTTDAGDKLQVSGAISAQPSGAGYLVFTRHGSQNTGLYYNGSQGLVLYTNTTTALTLDSSQNATFAGNVKFGKGGGNTTFSANGTTVESGIFTQANTGFVFFTDNATATKGIKVDVNNGGLTVLSGGLTTATAGGSAGTWKLGVYSATAPSATGFVTIDIGGTTYKLLAST